MAIISFKKYIKTHRRGLLITSGINALVILVIFGLGILFIKFNTNGLAHWIAPQTDSTYQGENLTDQESRVVDVVGKVNPAVVSIGISKQVEVAQNDNPLDLFGDLFPGQPLAPEDTVTPVPNGPTPVPKMEKKEIGGGSGFFISPNGYIVTNYHVVADKAATYTVYTNSGKKYDARVIARDPDLDIAVIKINGFGFPHLDFGDSSQLKQGQMVIAIGNVFDEFRNSVSSGVVSGLSRSIVAGDAAGNSEILDGVIQTDAAINPGNSGGPLLNSSGQVVGVTVAIARGSENVGFAIPVNTVKSAVDSAVKNGSITRPFLGIRYVQIDDQLKDDNNLPVNYGALVTSGDTADQPAIEPNSPAAKAGIKEGDIVLEMDGQKIDAEHTLLSLLGSKKPGEEITLKILHIKQETIVKLKLDQVVEK
jgi:serine protease Do